MRIRSVRLLRIVRLADERRVTVDKHVVAAIIDDGGRVAGRRRRQRACRVTVVCSRRVVDRLGLRRVGFRCGFVSRIGILARGRGTAKYFAEIHQLAVAGQRWLDDLDGVGTGIQLRNLNHFVVAKTARRRGRHRLARGRQPDALLEC